MKRVRLIFLALVLVIVICSILLSRPAPPAQAPKVAIRSLGPTGSFWSRTNEAGAVETGPYWTFVVTNCGPIAALWNPSIMLQTESNWSHIRSQLFWPSPSSKAKRPLRPGQQVVINMAVPGGTNVWREMVTYWIPPDIVQSTLLPVTHRVRWLRDRFPFPQQDSYYDDEWHTATNNINSSHP
jgi:hypothetical protein